MYVHPDREAVENLRRIVRMTFPTSADVVAAARKDLIELGEVVLTCTIPRQGQNTLNESEFLTHEAAHVGPTACGIAWTGLLSSSSYELLEKVTCPACAEYRTSLRKEIADAIQVGLGDSFGSRSFRTWDDKPAEFIWVEGHSQDPIRVFEDDVHVPEVLSDLGAGIRLDVQAILAERS